MDKPLKVEHVKILAQDYVTRMIPLETNILNALGVTRALQETVQADLDAMQNIEVLKSTLTEIEETLNSAGIEASNIRVGDLSDFIGQLAGQIVELTSEKTRLEGENQTLTTENTRLESENTQLQTEISEAETQLEVLI